ncbi:MAG TPA: NUDIX domain-containing protein [Nocardioidaceae bacterium]|nr:NUDIX domain-containing protein [Nocardioidaceae bacterium]
MPIPDFILDLRRQVGHAELWLPGVTAVVRRTDDILLVRRADNGQWTPVTGIVDPGEQPAVAARREVLEETGVRVQIEHLAWVNAGPPVVHANGDRARYLDHCFSCRYLDGEAHVADDESSEVGWFSVDALPVMSGLFRERIACALTTDERTRFETC